MVIEIDGSSESRMEWSYWRSFNDFASSSFEQTLESSRPVLHLKDGFHSGEGTVGLASATLDTPAMGSGGHSGFLGAGIQLKTRQFWTAAPFVIFFTDETVLAGAGVQPIRAHHPLAGCNGRYLLWSMIHDPLFKRWIIGIRNECLNYQFLVADGSDDHNVRGGRVVVI